MLISDPPRSSYWILYRQMGSSIPLRRGGTCPLDYMYLATQLHHRASYDRFGVLGFGADNVSRAAS